MWNYKAALKWANVVFHHVFIRHGSLCWLIRVPLSNLFAVLPLMLKMYLDTLKYLYKFLSTVLSSSQCYGINWVCQSNNNFIEMVNEALNMHHQIVQSHIYKWKFLHTVAQRSVNLKYSLVLRGMIRFKPASKSVSLWAVLWTWRISFRKFCLSTISNKDISNIF
jgi:hypothetical protein